MKTSHWITTFVCASLLTFSCAKPPTEAKPPGEEADGPSVKFEATVATVDPMGQPVTAEGANGLSPFRLLPDREVKTKHQDRKSVV